MTVLTLLETVEVPMALQGPESMTKVFDPWTLNRIKLTLKTSTLWDQRRKRKRTSSKVTTR